MSFTIKGLGLPYLGSKRKIAKDLLDFMLAKNPNACYFYDLFGGGGAVTFEAISRDEIKEVVYNEKNKAVVELLKDILENGVRKEYYNWIDRKTFHENKTKDNYFAGLCQLVWSFGNDQTSYIYSKEKERLNYLKHRVVVNDDKDALNKLNKLLNLILKLPTSNEKDFKKQIEEKRLKFMSNVKNRGLLRLRHLESINLLVKIDEVKDLINEKIKILNHSYEEVKFTTPKDKTIIYMDPPYKNTKIYRYDINHKELLEYIKTLTSKGYKIYVSSYEFEGLRCVYEKKHKSIICATNNNKRVVEKLFSL